MTTEAEKYVLEKSACRRVYLRELIFYEDKKRKILEELEKVEDTIILMKVEMRKYDN